jgi:hypothetical protein
LALVWANAYAYTFDYGTCTYILAKLRSCVPAERERERERREESRRQLNREDLRGGRKNKGRGGFRD